VICLIFELAHAFVKFPPTCHR